MRHFTHIILFSFLCSSFCIAQQGVNFSQQDWNQVVATAAKQNKIIFLDAYTDWCKPCKQMDKDVFPQKLVGDFYNENFINVKMNMEKGIGKELREKYDIFFYPTFLFITSDGTLVHRKAGYQSAPKLLNLGKTAVDPEKRLSAFDTRYANGDRDPKFLMKYTNIKKAAMDGTHDDIALEYLKTQEDWNTKRNLIFIYRNVNDTDSELFDYIVKNKSVFEKEFGAPKVAGKIENLIYQKIYDADGNADLEALDKSFAKVYPPEQAAQSSARFRLNYFLEKKSSEKYADTAIKYYDKYPPRDPSELTDVAFNFYELDVSNKKHLKKAVKWTKGAIKTDPSYLNYESLAGLYYRLGKKRKARKCAKKAIGIATKQNEDITETQKLLEKIKGM